MLRLVFLLMLILEQEKPCLGTASKINSTTVQEWAEKLKSYLLKMGRDVTNKTEIIKAFKLYSSKTKNGSVLVKEIASMIENMTKLKVSALKRIADTAEQVAMAHHGEEVPILYKYYSAKTEDPEGEPLNRTLVDFLEFAPSSHFHSQPINTSFSSVHVPTNVYDRAQDVLRAIKWSKELDDIFISNYQEDPSLSWQYFGSSTGILRQYPGSQWDESLLDLYDCRMRLWYTDAATSAKDVIILVDNSGSMKGLRQTIARHLVNNIVDTLGSNDFVNIFNFSEDFDSISCFKNGLVQANQGNLRELKLAMKKLKPEGMADFSKAFTEAFKLLSKYREQALGANCNQAIMIITDGIPYYYKDIFKEFNWYMLPQMPVRIFTYFLTEEIPDDREIRWIACANRGYYVSLNTLGEVREQVLRYLPVMSRPLVLSKEHPINWTPLYADITDSTITDWLWEQRENKEQEDVSDFCYPKRYKVRAYNRSTKVFLNCTEESKIKRAQDRNGEDRLYHFMTSVSVPVLDHWGNTSVDAFILGVAGTDVPIEDIKRLTFPEKIGVNGYMFIVTNNGHIVTHPDLRPLYLGILKPNFNSIDVLEIEQVDDNHAAREWNRELIELRKALVNQTTGKKTLTIKFHYDDMKRISGNITQHYYYAGISDTPFTLVIALPAHYGTKLVQVPNISFLGRNLTQYFRGSWNVHPEWDYCKYHYDSILDSATPEVGILHFLQRIRNGTWQWPKERFLTTPEQLLNTPPGKAESVKRDSYYCNRDLFEALIADAIATSSFPRRPNALYGVVLNFIATHSGLTRWQGSPENYKVNRKFIQENRKAIDELWYKRAVEQQEEGFVYSVTFGNNDGHEDDNLVTVSSAIWVPIMSRIPINKKVPAVVLGYRFQHEYLHHIFNNVTSSCAGCKITCASDELECYLLDNHGYVVASESTRDRGKFFGEIQGLVMESMVKDNIYRRVRIYDYQAICFRNNEVAEAVAPLMVTPLNHAKWMLSWLFQFVMQLLTKIGVNLIWCDYLATAAKPKPTMLPREQVKIQRTHLEHCDRQIDLHQLDPRLVTNGVFGDTPYCTNSYFVQKVNYSNLVIVVVNNNCVMEDEEVFTIMPEEVEYYNTTLACLKVDSIFTMDRQRPKMCINNDTKEPEITVCGQAVCMKNNFFYCFSFITFYILKVM